MIIMLSAWAKSGKDTLAAYMIQNMGYTRIAFADVLKDMVSEQYGVDRILFNDQATKESPIMGYKVRSLDAFSKITNEYLFREFRTITKQCPVAFAYSSEGYMQSETGASLFWTPRALAILEGSMKRSVNTDYWVSRAIATTLAKPNDKFVITDLRYKSEVAAVQRMSRGQVTKTARIYRFDTTVSTDSSERDLDNYAFDATVFNLGSLDEYLKHGQSVIEDLEYKK